MRCDQVRGASKLILADGLERSSASLIVAARVLGGAEQRGPDGAALVTPVCTRGFALVALAHKLPQLQHRDLRLGGPKANGACWRNIQRLLQPIVCNKNTHAFLPNFQRIITEQANYYSTFALRLAFFFTPANVPVDYTKNTVF